MMNASNICTFMGRLVKDPNYSSFQSNGNTLEKAFFTIAVPKALTQEQRQKVKNGDTSIQTADFIPCSAIGNIVNILKYLHQGSPIKVLGSYNSYSTIDKQTGQTKYGHEFKVEMIDFVPQEKGSNNNSGNNNNQHPNNNGFNQGHQHDNVQQPNFQQQRNDNFAMFDENESPF